VGAVVRVHRWGVPERLPLALHHPKAGARLLAHADAADGQRNGGVAHVLVAGVEQVLLVGEAAARVPELDAVGEELDDGLTPVVAVVLVDEKVHRGLAEDAEDAGACGRVAPLERGRVDVPERLGHEEEVLREELLPGLDDVHLAHEAIDPARRVEVLRAGIAEEPHVDDRLRGQVAHASQRAEQGPPRRA
jgi:hypothetical protein